MNDTSNNADSVRNYRPIYSQILSMGFNGFSSRVNFSLPLVIKMILKIIHFFIGHKWSEWIPKVWGEGYYDEERWKERTCICGVKQEDEE